MASSPPSGPNQVSKLLGNREKPESLQCAHFQLKAICTPSETDSGCEAPLLSYRRCAEHNLWAAAGSGRPSEHMQLTCRKIKCTLLRRGEEKTFTLERSLATSQHWHCGGETAAVPFRKDFKTRFPPKTQILGRSPEVPQYAPSSTHLSRAYCAPGSVPGSLLGDERARERAAQFGRRREHLAACT